MPPKLVWLDPSVTVIDSSTPPLVELDFGNIIAPGYKILSFRIGNEGDTIAEDLTFSVEGDEGDPAFTWKYLSNRPDLFDQPLSVQSLSIGNLGPDAVSNPLYIKSQPPAISASVATGLHNSFLVCDYIYV